MSSGLKAPFRLFIAGHTGLVGSALVRQFSKRRDVRLCLADRDQVNLLDPEAVRQFLAQDRPEAVILAAGRVGGIFANAHSPADFIYENLVMEANVIHAAFEMGVKHLINFGTGCMYPRETPQPTRPDQLMTGKVEATSEPYAVAKWAGMVLASAYQRQHGVRYFTVIPCTVYGPGDHFHSDDSHVLSALITKFHQAREEKRAEVTLWGTGSPRREFLFSDDLAQACDLLLERYEGTDPINIGSGEPVTIRALAEAVAQVTGFRGEIRWDSSQPDGAPVKWLDSMPMRALGWSPKTDLRSGLEKTTAWFLKHQLQEVEMGGGG